MNICFGRGDAGEGIAEVMPNTDDDYDNDARSKPGHKSQQVTLPCHHNSTSLSLKARPSCRCSEIVLAISILVDLNLDSQRNT
ncbi:hypothetical protein CISIN_1g039245mg [Citrus sinensis]|uniref:Uncharacterized protein n=1 Tax=Citrus sinensis TaxID=2711 RepID=A0A067D6M5_CITSI|nr:hypothetical protein CISIN_1g039245mg [Citrus sinensis]